MGNAVLLCLRDAAWEPQDPLDGEALTCSNK